MSEEIENIIEESLSPDRYCLVHNYIVSLQQKVEQLETIRKKAIEYINKHTNNDNCESKNILDLVDRDNLLNILNKGSENNELD